MRMILTEKTCVWHLSAVPVHATGPREGKRERVKGTTANHLILFILRKVIRLVSNLQLMLVISGTAALVKACGIDFAAAPVFSNTIVWVTTMCLQCLETIFAELSSPWSAFYVTKMEKGIESESARNEWAQACSIRAFSFISIPKHTHNHPCGRLCFGMNGETRKQCYIWFW